MIPGFTSSGARSGAQQITFVTVANADSSRGSIKPSARYTVGFSRYNCETAVGNVSPNNEEIHPDGQAPRKGLLMGQPGPKPR
jgi:hypothetical protein